MIRKILLYLGIFMLARVLIFISVAQARVEINIYDFGLLPYHATQGEFFLRHLTHFLRGASIASKDDRYRLAVRSLIIQTPEGKVSYFDIYVVSRECTLIPLCETEPSDFRNTRTSRQAARWMAAYVDFYIAAMDDEQLIYEEAGK